ncbi:ubiquitin carboxyl-terminal hydrolase [Puccinia sorghi]|uniref:Ubiquitin carboxyl-terminal hydrolase n=1 Tax=Puccinia sorghi TaxID=27349 RepID=A0A0L6V287_9BASI|nr:ubiquitin carboxyl-terminal hydrolase [Puccinia sorghi]
MPYATALTLLHKIFTGLDLVCRELFCLVCGAILLPDDHELKLLSRRLFPGIKRAFAPGCLARTTTGESECVLTQKNSGTAARGFRNLGNTCYMNVVLQILLRIPELQTYLLTDHHNRLKHRPTEDQPYCCCCVCELVDFLQHYSSLARSPSSESISPIGFLFALWANSQDGDEFAGYRESDAHECLLAF